MKSFGITDKEKQLLFVVLALAVLALSYFFGFTKLQDQTATIKASNVQDQTTVDNLRNMVSRQAETEQETERFKQTIKDIVAKYPSDVPQEKAIYQIQEMEDVTGVHVDNINFSMNNLVMNFSGENAPSGRYNTMGMHFSSNYSQFKDMLKFIRDYEDRCTAPSVSVEFDQSKGTLTGTVNYKTFFLTNTEKEYEEVPETGIESGVDSIFGTLINVPGEFEGEESVGRYVFPIEGLEEELQGTQE
ncbi:MAG: hypothetical protein IKQ25_13255 [Lachnospiraceae bacterium]|nr:hypothetical protein [Lachnospiraceae bacterium]